MTAAKQESPKPTETELRILNVLWKNGPSTVRSVLAALNNDGRGEVGYTTALKMMQIMTEKGLVERDESQRPQVYTPKLRQEQTQRQFVRDMLERVFGGSKRQLVMQALSSDETSETELAEIERMLDKIERQK